MFTPSKLSSLFQLSECCAKLLAGCLRVKYLPSKCASMHFWAERSAMWVWSCTFFFDLSLIWFNSDGIPVGFDSSLNGLRGFKTWGMEISRALEKVAQFRAKCSKSASSNSASRTSLCLKIYLPLRMSQGSETLSCGLWQVDVIPSETDPAAGEWAKDLFTDSANLGDWSSPYFSAVFLIDILTSQAELACKAFCGLKSTFDIHGGMIWGWNWSVRPSEVWKRHPALQLFSFIYV